jgi:flagellar hook-associated protein 2
MSIQIDGIVSGVDTTSLIKAIVASSGIPKASLQARIDEYETKSTRISELISRLNTAQTALLNLEDATDFDVYSATYADNDAFTVELSDGAVKGSYDIEVSQLATNEMWVANGVSSKTDTLASLGFTADTLDVTYNGVTTSVTVNTSGTLADLAASITSEVEGVSAYVMNVGTGANPYRLVIQGTNTGEDYDLSFGSTSGVHTALGLDNVANRAKQAQNAIMSINGVDAESASNTVTEVVTGMSFSLTGTTTSAVTVEVGDDVDTLAGHLQDFVDAFNSAVDMVKAQSVYNAEEGIKGAFVGESSVRTAMQSILSSVTGTISHLTGLGNAFTSAMDLGLESDGKGKLTFDAATFKAAYATNRDDVIAFFTTARSTAEVTAGDDPKGFVDAVSARLDLYIDSTTGSLSIRTDGLEERIGDMEDQMLRLDDRIASLQTRLREQFTAMESTISQLQSGQAYLTQLLATTTTSTT